MEGEPCGAVARDPSGRNGVACDRVKHAGHFHWGTFSGWWRYADAPDIDIEWHLSGHQITDEEEATWAMWPIGDRARISALMFPDQIVYVDGEGNPLEPGWVLRQLRGQDAEPAAPAWARPEGHPWMERG